MDWNNDGKKDLIAGEYEGYIRIYLNTNTDEDPVFQGHLFLQVKGVKYDCGKDAAPHVVDWNNDGKKDVLCGMELGRVLLLINVGTDQDPVFDAAVPLKDGSNDLDAGNFASPTVTDWNRDGKKDLLVSESYGRVYFYENVGTDAHPVFNGSSAIEIMGGPTLLDAGGYVHLDVADWDGDGVMDILCGDNYGYLYYFHALGPLSLSHNRIFASMGGAVDLSLNAGLSNRDRGYLVLGSVSGTEPGTPLPGGGASLPLNWDFFTNLVLVLINTPVFDNFTGTLDDNGEAEATFDTLGPAPAAAGLYISLAYALNKPWNFASNGATIEVVP